MVVLWPPVPQGALARGAPTHYKISTRVMEKITNPSKSCAPCKAAAARSQEAKVASSTSQKAAPVKETVISSRPSVVSSKQVEGLASKKVVISQKKSQMVCRKDTKLHQEGCKATVTINNCQAELVFPKWQITKTGESNCFNANGVEKPTATFEVVVTRPNTPPTLVWLVSYTITNNGEHSIIPGDCDGSGAGIRIVLIQDDGTETPFLVNYTEAILAHGQVTLAFAQNTVLTQALCDSGATFSVRVEVCGVCDTTISSRCACVLLKLETGDCANSPSYVLTDSLISNCGEAVVLTIDDIEGQSADCSSLSAINEYIANNGPFPINVDTTSYIFIENSCFVLNEQTGHFDPITLTLTATCNETPEDCPTTPITFTNTASLTLAQKLVAGHSCPEGTTQQQVVGESINNSEADPVFACLSDVDCDTISTPPVEVTPDCVKPAVCVINEVDCQQSLCVCKTSTVIPPHPSGVCATRTRGCWITGQGQGLRCEALRLKAAGFVFYFPVTADIYVGNDCRNIIRLVAEPAGFETIPVPYTCVTVLDLGEANTFFIQLYTALLNVNVGVCNTLCAPTAAQVQCICDALKFVTNAITGVLLPVLSCANIVAAIVAAIEAYTPPLGSPTLGELTDCLTNFNNSGDDVECDSPASTPAQIEYNVEISQVAPKVCEFTPKFAFNACPGTEAHPRFYRYEILLDGEVVASEDDIHPCTTADIIIAPGDECLTCHNIPASCLITASAISIADTEGATLTLVIYTTDVNAIVQVPLISAKICVPSDSPLNVWLGDCIQVIQGHCDFVPSRDNLIVTKPADGTVIPDTFPDGTTAEDIRKAIANLLFGVPGSSGILDCHFDAKGNLIPPRQLTSDELKLLLAFGLQFTITLPEDCCGCIVVKNTIRLVTGVQPVDGILEFPGLPEFFHCPAPKISDVTQSVYDTVQLADCPPPTLKAKSSSKSAKGKESEKKALPGKKNALPIVAKKPVAIGKNLNKK